MSSAPRPHPERPAHTHPRLVALVAVGGAIGTALRAAVAAALGDAGTWPWSTWAVNLTGAFALGLLLEHLARRGPDDGRRREVRLLAGTGLLGGYTTYSTFALDAVLLADAGRAAVALLYAGSSVVLGVAAAGAGVAVGRHAHRRADRDDDRALSPHDDRPVRR
ncbi:CrcB family protein [uncultured Cellulomonas sp.]|uniref:fluoride efflux transporter FluC n=1 Tax=uncultured Cellulomonas sp. TaxID=189682 RepID=UPI00262ACF1B|nr:CrcB family protein [uncultured Cellulomonas sp.]